MAQYFDPEDPTIKQVCARVFLTGQSSILCRTHTPTVYSKRSLRNLQEIVCLIMQYLQDEGYNTSFLTMQDESNVRLAEQQTQRTLFKRMRKAILGVCHLLLAVTSLPLLSPTRARELPAHPCPVPIATAFNLQRATGSRSTSSAAR